MNYSKLQKSIASIIIPFFFFTMVFNFNTSFFYFSNAGDSKVYSLVSILVNQDIYNDVSNSVETYAEDISKQLKNTKVVIIPTPTNSSTFNIASLNEGLYYEGYKNIDENIDFKSKLVGTVFIGKFPIPTVYKGKEYSTTILPYVDFEDKSYIYNHETRKYEKNSDNIEGIKPEIWHGIISPNTGNKEKNIEYIKNYFEKNHNYYEGTGNFKKENGIINGKVNEKNPTNYKPYVFYFDQIREQKGVKYPNYLGYQSYLKNKEAINYNRYSKELAENIQKDVLDFPGKEINNLISQIPGAPTIDNNQEGLDLSKSSDIMSKAVIDKATKSFLEVINSSKIGDFRKDVNNAGRYSQNGKSVNVDMIPYIISVLDKIGDQSIKSADKVIENKIDNLVMSGGLSRNIALPTKIIYKARVGNTQRPGLSCDKEYTNILYGKVASEINKAEECTFYRGNNDNSGTLVQANRGLDISNISSDTQLCNNGKTTGYWGGLSPLNLEDFEGGFKKTDGEFILKNNSYFKAIKPLYDIKGSKYVSDNSKVANPYNCYKDANNYVLSKVEKTASCEEFVLPINNESPKNFRCENNNIILPFNKTFSENYIEQSKKSCERRKMLLDGLFVTEGKEKAPLDCFGKDRGHSKDYYYKSIPSYIKHISPTQKELKGQIKQKVAPNLPIDVDRYIDFIGASGKKDKIKYTNLFRLKEELSDNDNFNTQLEKVGTNLDLLLEKKSAEINTAIINNDPSLLGYPDNEIYENYLKIADYPNEKIDLKKYLKNYETKKIDIFGEEKELSYYDDIKFSLFWNNLKTVGQKYKFVFENYLSDQTSSEFKHFLPKNKKSYEIAYLGAPGNTQNMYIGIDPEEKGENPYSQIEKENALLDNELFSFSVNSSQSGLDTWNSNIGTTNFEETENNENEATFKCAPPEGVSLLEWPGAISCRIKDLFPVEINFDSSRCSSETLFGDENEEIDNAISKIADINSNNGGDDGLNNGGGENTQGTNNQTCRNDLNENGVEDCTEKNLKDAKIELISSAKKAHINTFIGLEARFLDKQGIVYKDLNNVKTKFELIRIVDKKTNKVIKKDDYKNYINFNESEIPSKKGHSKYSITSKNKEADYYLRATGFINSKEGEEIINIKSNIIKIEIRNELFSSLLNKITNSNDNIFNKGENEILASDKKNIYLIDLNNGKLEDKIEKIKNNSEASEKIIISLNHYSNGNKQIPLDYPLKLSLTKNGKRVIEDLNITKNNLSNFYSPYSLSKSGEYKLKITNNYGETTTKSFTIIPEKANNVDLFLSTNILEKEGDITSNIFTIKDKFGNISSGYNYKVVLKSEGNFSFPLNNGENLNSKKINVYNGYKGFRLKPGNKNGVGNIKINILYNDKIIATKNKSIQTIEKIKVNITKPEIIKVGGDKYKFKLDFIDSQGNLLKNLNSRVYLSINKIYGITKNPYFPIVNGKAIIDFKTKNIAGEEIPIELKMDGLREIIKDSITIEPEEPVKLDINLSEDIAKASVNEQITAIVSLKDRFNNTVFNDDSTQLKIDILDKYKNIIKLNSPINQVVEKGETTFEFNATSEPGTAYLKFSTIPNLSDNTFEINGKTINGVGEKSAKIKTFYFWDKDSFKNKKYNSLYTVMLGADYGNVREKDYLASSILFNKNNRNLAITSLLNNPYKKTDLISIYSNGKIKDVSSKNNITQDLELTTSINNNNKISINIFNRILNRQIGKINYNFLKGNNLSICETTIGECLINKDENSINIKPESDEYQIKKEDGKISIEKDGLKILKIDKEGNFISNTLLKLNIDKTSKEDYLVIDINKDNSEIAKIILNISNENLEYKLTNTSYNIRNINIDGNLVKNIYSNNFLESDDSVNNFSQKREDDIENFRKKGSIGWGGENKFLLDFAAGKNVGEAVKYKQSFSTINLGDPIISLKPIRTNFKDGTKKSFNATIGKKISNSNNIKNYKIFDYDNDSRDDILLIKNDGYLELLENKTNAKNFLDKGNLAYISDKGNPDFVKTGDFTGDGFDDIFFVNNKGIPGLLNNENKDFKRTKIEEQIKLKGKIVQVETFDMDNDGKTDIITLDDSGEINIFYGGGTANKPEFTKKLVGNGTGLILSNEPRNNGALINFDGLYQIPSKPNTSTGIVNEDFLNRQIFVKQIVGANATPGDNLGKDIYKTFIKSEYSNSAGIEIKKVFKDLNGETLKSGDIVEVEVTIKNISSSIKRNVSYLDKIQKPFTKSDEKINYKELGFSEPISGYDFYLKNFNLAPGAEKKVTYKLKTPSLKYGNIKVGLFEKGEIGDDLYGDIIIKKDNKNCSDNSKIYKSILARTYTGLKTKQLTCDQEKLKLPDEIEDAKKINIDDNNNSIPDYIDKIKDNPDKAKEYAKEKLDEYNNSENDLIQKSDNNFLDSLDDINNWTDEKLEDLDNLIEGFSCGFGGGSCISTPLNWAPLAPGNDPTLFGIPVGDGLKVEEGMPIYSSLTIGKPHTWPPNAGGAGGYLGTTYPLNTYRLFVTPTLTGGAGTAICFGGPPAIAGRSNPPGLSPIVPGGNCIVAAKPLLSCSNDGSEGDPESMGVPDNFGGSNGGGGGQRNGNGDGFGVINGNCGYADKSSSQTLNKNFINKYYNNLSSGLGYPTSFETEYKDTLEGFNNNLNSGIDTNSLFSFNGEGVGEQSLEVGVDFSNIEDTNFQDIVQIKKDRVSPFPSFLMDWVTRQIEEVVTKLSDFPTLFIILPDFSGIIDTDWTEFGKKSADAYSDAVKKEKDNNKILNNKIKGLESQKNQLKCSQKDKLKCLNIDSKIKILEAQKLGTSGKAQVSGIKAAYEFLSNVPIIELEPQQINIDIPFPDTNTLDKFIVDSKSTLIQWKNEVNLGKINGSANSDIQNLISNLEQNIEIAEEYKEFPRKLTKLLNQKEIRINQVMCSVNSISEITGGWIGRNGKRFKAWVETYILIKSVLKSWQLLIDVFLDYEAECHECKNERQDLLQFEFKLISMILPKFPVIQFPKWPDLILDLHNIRASINIKIPDVVINNRPLVLPNIPELTLPEVNANIDLNIPDMPLLPRFEFPELPDIPTLPDVNLPDLPPPPLLPKIFSELEGVLKILKLITKAMCLLKQLPFVPEWRAGDQIAFLTERNGYLPTDFIDLSLPQFSIPYLDAIKVTTYVNLEQDTTFLVDTLRNIIDPLNSTTNNWANKFSNAGMDNLDFSSSSVNINKKIDLDKKTSFSKEAAKDINKLFTYIEKNKDTNISSKKFLNNINKSLANNIFTSSTRTDKIKKLWKDVNNYNFNKENKLISELKDNNRDKFENLNNILENELNKNYKLKKDLKNYLNKDRPLFTKISSKTNNKDFVEYNKSLKKYNDNFIDSAKNLISGKNDYQVDEIKKEGKNLLTRVNGGLNSFNKNINNNTLLATTNGTRTRNGTQNSCSQANHSGYNYNYKGLYIIEKGKSYRLFNYIEELNGKEEYNPIDFDKDGDLDLLYMVNGEIYLKENLDTQKNRDLQVEVPITLQVDDNKYFNGEGFVEAINGFKEINSDSGYLNLVFKSPTDKSINHFIVEYYTIIDKFINQKTNDGISKHYIDTFIEKNNGEYKDNFTKKYSAYINYIGDIPAVRLDTYEMKNIGESLLSNKKINLSSTTPIYTANNSAKISYYIGKNEDEIFEKNIAKNSSLRFKDKITIIAINGKVYSKGNKKINLVGAEIKDYIGLPLFPGSEFSVIPDLKNKLNKDLANVEIKYSSGYKINLNFTEIDSYYYYNLGAKSKDYLIRTPEVNDYYYGKIHAIKDHIEGTYGPQKLFSPQLASDRIAPEIDGLSKIRIPVYQEKNIDLRKYIYENSGINGIKDIQLKLSDNSNILPDNYTINKSINNLSISFGKFNKLFKEKIEIILEDNNGNKSSTPVDFEVYSPKPEILGNKGNKIRGQIDEKLLEEPINIYRIRSGIIKRLETKNGKIKTYTVDEGLFDFDAKGDNNDGLYVKYNNKIIAEINETTGKINIKNNNYKISVENNNSLYPEIVINDNAGNKIYSQFIKLDKNINIFKKEDFNKINKNGLYIKINNSEYEIYNIPNGAKYSAGVNVIYKKSDDSKKPIFTIFPDGRIKYSNRYIINYEDNGNDIILELNSRIGNKKIAELLFKINATYLIK